MEYDKIGQVENFDATTGHIYGTLSWHWPIDVWYALLRLSSFSVQEKSNQE